MAAQFGRLASKGHRYVHSLHSFFHSVYVELGNPVGYPKLANPLKAAILAGILLCVPRALHLARVGLPRLAPGRIAAAAALPCAWALFFLKPEAWFLTLLHLTFWPLVAASLRTEASDESRLGRRVGISTLVAIAVLEAGVAIHQWSRTRGRIGWPLYERWASCVDRVIGSRGSVWQPHWPDVLAELHRLRPARDYSRFDDFGTPIERLRAHALSRDAIAHTRFIALDDPASRRVYSGVALPEDVAHLTVHPWITNRELSAPYIGMGWRLEVCQEGPFWAGISVRSPP